MVGGPLGRTVRNATGPAVIFATNSLLFIPAIDPGRGIP